MRSSRRDRSSALSRLDSESMASITSFTDGYSSKIGAEPALPSDRPEGARSRQYPAHHARPAASAKVSSQARTPSLYPPLAGGHAAIWPEVDSENAAHHDHAIPVLPLGLLLVVNLPVRTTQQRAHLVPGHAGFDLRPG